MTTTIYSFDPGLRTGYSIWTYDAITPLQHVQHGTIAGGLQGFIEFWIANDVSRLADEVVMESFRLDGRTVKPDTTPLEIQGAAAVFCRLEGLSLALQTNTYKAHMPDEKIKELGLWWPGLGHDRDSLRHAWALLKVRKHYPTLMLGFPPSEAPAAPRLKLVGGF